MKERIVHMQTSPDHALIQPASLDNIEWPIPSGEHFQDPPIGEIEEETKSLVKKLHDEGKSVSQKPTPSYHMQLELETLPSDSEQDFPH